MPDRHTIVVQPPIGGSVRTLYGKGLTIVHPYYGEEARFNYMYDNYWSKYPDNIKSTVRIFIGDDCGSPSVANMMRGRCPDFDMRIFRITDNLKYNTPGALNLASTHVNTDYMLQMDSDCVMDTENLDKLLKCAPSPNHFYKFRRKRITADPVKAAYTRWLPCANLLNKQAFQAVHGFDEDFTGERSGGYGFFDNHFDHKLLKAGYKRAVIDGIIVTEYMEQFATDSNGPLGVGVFRTEGHQRTNKRLYRAKQRGDVPESKEMLRFNWVEDNVGTL